jgi:hypothetical protein
MKRYLSLLSVVLVVLVFVACEIRYYSVLIPIILQRTYPMSITSLLILLLKASPKHIKSRHIRNLQKIYP